MSDAKKKPARGTVLEYQTVTAPASAAIDRLVALLIKSDWQPYGGQHHARNMYTQVMVKVVK